MSIRPRYPSPRSRVGNSADFVKNLNSEKRIDLAAKLTQAAMSAIDYKYEGPQMRSQEELTLHAADRTYVIFYHLLQRIDSAEDPEDIAKNLRVR